MDEYIDLDQSPVDNAALGTIAQAPEKRVIAALDLGTNNCRLLVAHVEDRKPTVIEGFSRIVRLGEGMAETGRLSDAAMARTLEALRICARILRRHRLYTVRAVATEACRRAVNAERFIAYVERTTGLIIETISPREEISLALLGCAPLVDKRADHVLVIDIGGGSTDLLYVDRTRPHEPIASLSIPTGVVSLAEVPGLERSDYDRMKLIASDAILATSGFQDFAARIKAEKSRIQVIGTSGTVTTVAALGMKLQRYERDYVDGKILDSAIIDRTVLDLLAMTPGERGQHPCIGAGRADLVLPGCAILDSLRSHLQLASLVVADRGVREGILLNLAGHRLEDLGVATDAMA